MKRIQLFELEDFPWFPAILRNMVMDYLQLVVNKFGLYRPAYPLLVKLQNKTNCFTIIDLGSGSSGPLLDILKYFEEKDIRNLKLVLTDFYPNPEAFAQVQKQQPDQVSFVSSPVDARHIPRELNGIRTFFNTFHHFTPPDARHILEAAARSGQSIAIFELAGRNPLTIFYIILSPIFTLILTPFLKPRSLTRFFLTYIIPLIPLVVLWDGLVSSFRTYSRQEFQNLTGSIENSGYLWEYRRIKGRFGTRISCMLGYPNKTRN
jgi:hypothetical protein